MKHSTANIAIAVGSTLLSILGIFIAIEIYLVSCRTLGIDANRRLGNSKFIRTCFVDNDYKALLQVLTEEDTGRFKAVWDFNQAIALSRALFIPTEMFGEQKYVYRSHLEMCYARVWTGPFFKPLIVPESPRFDELITHCHTSRLVCFSTDLNGFKNDDTEYEAVGPTILFLGDSFTEGLWVAKETAFPHQFAELLRKDGISYRVLNLGVNGYSALEMRWVLEHFAPSLSPKAAIMNLFPNDVDVDYFNVDIPAENYDRMFADLDKALEYSRKHGISLYISIVPAKEQFSVYGDQMDFQRRVTAWCEAQKLKCLDPYGFFAGRGGEKLYFDWDPHLTEEGHRVYAEFLTAELRTGLQELR